MIPPPPPPRKRKAPPPPKARNLELERIRHEDSFIAPFVAGDFSVIPDDVMPILREACEDSASSKKITARLKYIDLFGAIFTFTEYPQCSLADGAKRLKEIVRTKTPFSVIDSRAIGWLAAETEFKSTEDRKKI